MRDDDKPTTLHDLLRMVRDEVKEAVEDYNLLEEVHGEDRLHEIADGCVPVYNYELLQVAASDCNLAVDEPDCGPAFDGTPTPANIIAANIYERLLQTAYEAFQELKEAAEEAQEA